MFNKPKLFLITIEIMDFDCPPFWTVTVERECVCVALGEPEGIGREEDGNQVHISLRSLPRKREEMVLFCFNPSPHPPTYHI